MRNYLLDGPSVNVDRTDYSITNYATFFRSWISFLTIVRKSMFDIIAKRIKLP